MAFLPRFSIQNLISVNTASFKLKLFFLDKDNSNQVESKQTLGLNQWNPPDPICPGAFHPPDFANFLSLAAVSKNYHKTVSG